jgi:hypothetical protein
MTMRKPLSRRTVLKGLGTALALPMLEAMTPVLGWAGSARKTFPTRMAFLYVPNGIHMPNWTPAAVGGDFALPPSLEPLQPFKQELLVLSGLTADKARPHGDGPGDHARAMSAFLTGRQPRKTSGTDIRAGISVDQLAAQKVGAQTRLPSLELGCDRGLNSGNCDSGYSCAYSANLSWRSESMPMAKEINPRLVFERLFGNQARGETESTRAKRERYQLSILDFVLEDASQLKMRLGSNDQRKLDEYLSSVREIETRIARAGQTQEEAAAGREKPTGIPTDYQEHLRIMGDLLALAFQADLTRIATLVFANDGSNRNYRFIGVPDGHHDLSHHGQNQEKQAKIGKINRFHIEQLAYLLGKLNGIREGEGSLLDNCMILYGSGISDGNRHNHDELPILVAGRANGTLRTGHHLRFPKETPLTNLFVSMLDRIGAPTDSFGDSTGRLEALDV